MVGGASDSTEFASVRGGELPTAEVGRGGESVNGCIEHEFECARLQLKHGGLPD